MGDCGRAELRPGLPEGTAPGALRGARGAMSSRDLPFSVCRTERWLGEIIHRRHQPPLGHGQRLRTAPASSRVTDCGRCGGTGGFNPHRPHLQHGPSRPWAGHKGRSANISLWDEPPLLFRGALGGLPLQTARIALGEVGISPH